MDAAAARASVYTRSMRTAIVHEWIMGWVGSEKVTGAIARMYPGAPIYATVVDAKVLKGTALEGREVRRGPGSRGRLPIHGLFVW